MREHLVVILIKCLMLERRVVVYSKLSSRVSEFYYSVLGLLPG